MTGIVQNYAEILNHAIKCGKRQIMRNVEGNGKLHDSAPIAP